MDYEKDKLTKSIIECIINVHKTLGPGFLENIYRKSLCIELIRYGLKVEDEKEISVYYKNVEVGRHRLDILVENLVIVELKTVERLSKTHYAQIKSYLKACNLKTGLLVNFFGEKADYRRVEI